MGLSKIAKLILEGKKKIRYDMQNVNGGFADGVSVKPGTDGSQMSISVDIYGGSRNGSLTYNVPPSIKELQDAYLAAKRTGDPVTEDIKKELEDYYKNLRTAISLEMARLMQELDGKAVAAINGAVEKINQKYT